MQKRENTIGKMMTVIVAKQKLRQGEKDNESSFKDFCAGLFFDLHRILRAMNDSRDSCKQIRTQTNRFAKSFLAVHAREVKGR